MKQSKITDVTVAMEIDYFNGSKINIFKTTIVQLMPANFGIQGSFGKKVRRLKS